MLHVCRCLSLVSKGSLHLVKQRQPLLRQACGRHAAPTVTKAASAFRRGRSTLQVAHFPWLVPPKTHGSIAALRPVFGSALHAAVDVLGFTSTYPY